MTGEEESFELPMTAKSRHSDQVSLSDLHFTQVYELLEREAQNRPTESIDLTSMTQATMVNRFADVSNNELAESMF